jgi:hypothetical protein
MQTGRQTRGNCRIEFHHLSGRSGKTMKTSGETMFLPRFKMCSETRYRLTNQFGSHFSPEHPNYFDFFLLPEHLDYITLDHVF